MKAESPSRDFPVVCVGGSAGGLDAYIRLLRNLPPDMGGAIVIVNHLRIVATRLHEILPRYTKMPVELITEKLLIRPNHVFIIPPKRDLHVLDGEFRLKPISKPRGWPDVITVFLRSFARNWGGKLIAVIVSGYDGGGAAALREIKEVGGVTIAQRLDTAQQPDMPESAIDTRCIDFVLSPEDIAEAIMRIAGETTKNLTQKGVASRLMAGRRPIVHPQGTPPCKTFPRMHRAWAWSAWSVSSRQTPTAQACLRRRQPSRQLTRSRALCGDVRLWIGAQQGPL